MQRCTSRNRVDTAGTNNAWAGVAPECIGVLNQCFRRVRAWRVPPNWCARDWFAEMKAQGAAAAWQAECEFDPSHGAGLASFVYWRVVASSLTRYRQEWRYAAHCVLKDSFAGAPSRSQDTCDDGAAPGNSLLVLTPFHQDLEHALMSLTTPEQQLIKRLFWEECTEAGIAKEMGTTQQAISKRKQRILSILRHLLRESETEESRAGCENCLPAQ